jgi:hypothetical protein
MGGLARVAVAAPCHSFADTSRNTPHQTAAPQAPDRLSQSIGIGIAAGVRATASLVVCASSACHRRCCPCRSSDQVRRPAVIQQLKYLQDLAPPLELGYLGCVVTATVAPELTASNRNLRWHTRYWMPARRAQSLPDHDKPRLRTSLDSLFQSGVAIFVYCLLLLLLLLLMLCGGQ